MLIKGHEFNQESRQEVRNAHTVLDSDMIARGKVEKLAGQEVDLIYVRHPHPTNVVQAAVKAWDH
jgi:hypothetical protein